MKAKSMESGIAEATIRPPRNVRHEVQLFSGPTNHTHHTNDPALRLKVFAVTLTPPPGHRQITVERFFGGRKGC
ncbi:MAG: hypothetical protein ACRD1R_07880, partial [Acidobacteriota bacterium]